MIVCYFLNANVLPFGVINDDDKRPTGACPLRNLIKLSQICGQFRERSIHVLNFVIFTFGVPVLWGFKGAFFPRIFSAFYRRNYTLDRKHYGNTNRYRPRVWWGLDFTCHGGDEKV